MLHQKIELHTEHPPEEMTVIFRDLLRTPDSGFHGREENDGFVFDYKSKGLNAFRPEIHMQLLPDGDGCLLWADMRLPAAMLWFMIFWTALPTLLALQGKASWLILLSIPVFWAIALFSFRSGVNSAKQALMASAEAFEIID